MITERESLTISYLRAFAIFSVVCAHVSVVSDSFSETNTFICQLVSEIGAIGVGLFFSISGYLFKRKAKEAYKLPLFFSKKLHSLVIPWVIAASLVYLYVAIRKGGTVLDGILSILGYKSSYWYMAVLMIIYLMFCFVIKSSKETGWIALFILLSVISVILRYLGIIGQTILGVYLNVFNWCIFFAVGYVVAMNVDRLLKIIEKYKLPIIISSGIISTWALVVPLILKRDKFSYFCFWYIPIELLICIFLTTISFNLSNKNFKILKKIGDISYPIYLYNELLWAGLTVAIFNRYDSALLIIIRPFIVIACVCCELYLGSFIFGLFNKKDWFNKIVGARIR